MKNKETRQWIPIYIDKWIFGSTRLELEPDERSVFMDLMCLSAKDEGYIRANESMGYLPKQLAGILNISEELLFRTIEKCICYGKLEKRGENIYYISKWENYQFSRAYKHKVSEGNGGEEVSVPKQEDGGKEVIFFEKMNEIVEKSKEIKYSGDFILFWNKYPKKIGKAGAYRSWKTHKPPIEKCLTAISFQMESKQWQKDNGQYIPLPQTWINQHRWEDRLLPEWVDKDLYEKLILHKETAGEKINELDIFSKLLQYHKEGRDVNFIIKKNLGLVYYKNNTGQTLI